MKPIFPMIKRRVKTLLYPSDYVCPVCGKEAWLDGVGLCADCHGQLRPCGKLSPPAPLDGLYAVYFYDSVLHSAMHRFKYSGQTWLARFFLRDVILPTDLTFDAMVPVPMHPWKAYRRGYNPPEALALALQERQSCPPIRTDLLRKIKLTPSQTALSAKDRSRNVEDVFLAAASVRGLTILLIDDVTTTGSTLISCANALKAAGAARVYALCACKAVMEDRVSPNSNETER